MRILIDIDGMQAQGAAASPLTGSGVGSGSDGAPHDGGHAPTGGGGDLSVSTDTAIESGSPPDWLLQAISAAEARQGTSADAREQTRHDHQDGGGAPST
jgi:hypothetical protein